MTNAELIAKIKAEIERLENYYTSVEWYVEALLSFLSDLEKSLPAKAADGEGLEEDGSSEIPNDLEEAAEKYVSTLCDRVDESLRIDTTLESAFKAGAEWQEKKDMKVVAEIHQNGYNLCKEQMMKEAVEGEIVKDISNKLAVTAKINLDGFKFGDKVRIIIVKED